MYTLLEEKILGAQANTTNIRNLNWNDDVKYIANGSYKVLQTLLKAKPLIKNQPTIYNCLQLVPLRKRQLTLGQSTFK